MNTSAAVKAESDICCTSGNAVQVIESLGVPEVIMIPDQFLAANIARQTGVEVITHPGACEVHERFTPADIRQVRADYPGVTVLAHPECPPEVVDEADYAGSTAQMVTFVDAERPLEGGPDHRVLDERQRRRRPTPTSSSSGPATCART